jgi:hypothetical protein
MNIQCTFFSLLPFLTVPYTLSIATISYGSMHGELNLFDLAILTLLSHSNTLSPMYSCISSMFLSSCSVPGFLPSMRLSLASWWDFVAYILVLTFVLGSKPTVPSKFLLFDKLIWVPLSKSQYKSVLFFKSRSKRTYSMLLSGAAYWVQATFALLLSDGPLSFLTGFLITKFSPLLRRPFAAPRNTPSFSASKAGKVFGIACPFNRYRLYSGFLSISKITLIGHVACFTTTTTLTHYASFAPDLSSLVTSVLSSTTAVSAVASKYRHFQILTIVWMSIDFSPCVRRMFLRLSDRSSVPQPIR